MSRVSASENEDKVGQRRMISKSKVCSFGVSLGKRTLVVVVAELFFWRKENDKGPLLYHHLES